MSMRKIWFGVPRYMQWIEPFTTAPNYERKGRSEFTQYLNGGTGRTGSLANHMEYTVSWNANKRDALRPIMDYAEGVYGDDYLYWIDPVAADKNVLPQAWATPWLASKDAQPLLFENRPKAIENADFSQGYPAFMARYEVTADSTPAPLFVPIPPGYTAWVGAHGNAGFGGSVQVTPNNGDAIVLDMLGVDEATRFTDSFEAADYDTAAGITLSLSNSGVGRKNLSTNPGLEINATGWSATGSTVTRDTATKHSGAASAKSVTAGSASAEGVIHSIALSGMSGKSYSAGAWVKAPIGATLYMVVRTGNSGTGDSAQTAITGTGDWVYYSTEEQVADPGDAAFLQLHVRTTSAQAITFYVDDAILQEGSGPQFDGTASNAKWDGATGASTSTIVSVSTDIAGMMVQILPNGQTPLDGAFISGRGNSGCKFDSPPIEVPIMVPDDVNDLITLSAKLVEVGQWENVAVDLPSPVPVPVSTWHWADDPSNPGYLIEGSAGAPTWADDPSNPGYLKLGASSTLWVDDPANPGYLKAA